MAKRKTSSAKLKNEIKALFSKGLEAVQARKDELQARRDKLQQQINDIDTQIAQLDADLQAAVRDSLQELNLASAVKRKKSTPRQGTLKQWLIDTVTSHGSLTSTEIYAQARQAGLNTKSLALTLSKAAKAGDLKAQDMPGKRGKRYSAA